MTEYRGGYYNLHQPIINTGIYAHTAGARDLLVPPAVLDSLNRVQETRWGVNRFVFDVLTQCWRDGRAIAGIPSAQDRPLPTRIPNDEWKLLSVDERRRFKDERIAIYGENARAVSHRLALIRKMAIVNDLLRTMDQHADIDAIYFPHNLDFRGRVYPLCQDLNPQVDDAGRALLYFADGKPLTKAGAYWLGVHLANAWGYDKAALDERVGWVDDHAAMIQSVVADPLGDLRWTEAAEPWQFLAAAHEFDEVVLRGNWEDVPSHLPVQVDGTCNGLQHLAAMGRDPIGALATNLRSMSERQDVYETVARRTEELRSRDAAEGVETALHWAERIDRSVVKRAVMTTPYGITDIGMRDQLLEDRHAEGLEGSPIANATYLRDILKEALSDVITSAKDVMGWLQDVARIKAEDGKVMRWTTPTGLEVRQAYWRRNRRTVQTLIGGGRWSIQVADPKKGIDRRKQYLAAAPNVVHSFDAAHLTDTVNRCYDRGVRHFSVIHDSFGTHAADVPTLHGALRESFVTIYQQDWLSRLAEDFKQDGTEIPAPPRLGDFDVTEVLDADYFFS